MITTTLRRWTGGFLVLLIGASPLVAETKEETVQQQIDLSTVANAPFSPRQAQDQWANQGGELIGELGAGKLEFANVSFRVLEGDKSLVVLGGEQEDRYPESAIIDIPTQGGRHLYLLNAVLKRSWGNTSLTGTVEALYADGARSQHEINSHIEVADWWRPNEPTRGALVWQAENDTGRVGLTVTHIELQDKPLERLGFTARGESVWLIAAATLSQSEQPLPRPKPFYVTEGECWIPFHDSRTIEVGSALDFSMLVEAPAGKYGHITIRDGHFYWEKAPEKRARFFGTNLCFTANFPSHDVADALADYLVRMGYNSVRLHHYDRGLIDPNAPDSTTLDPDQLDRIHYLIAACKKRGLYISIDLYTVRRMKAHEVPEIGKPLGMREFKALAPILPSVTENWKTFARNFLTSHNPYTGMSLAEDPVLIGVAPVNEDPVGNDAMATPEVAAIYTRAFEEWKSENGIEPKGEEAETQALARFYGHVQERGNAIYFDFLKNELGVKAPLTGVNALETLGLAPIRSRLDYVDNHQYWDHPIFPLSDWDLPFTFHQESATEAAARTPRTVFPSRIFGLPFTFTEWNYTNPNQHRAEGALLMAAYAALQDWDGIWRFAHAHSRQFLEEVSPADEFDLATDPLARYSELIAGALYQRQDVAPAKTKLVYLVNEAEAHKQISRWGAPLGVDPAITFAGLSLQVGSLWAPNGTPARDLNGFVTGSNVFAGQNGYVSPDRILAFLESRSLIESIPGNDPEQARYVSETGQLQINPGLGQMKAVTLLSEAFTFSKPGEATGQNMHVQIDEGFGTVAAISIDGKPLGESQRILLLHLTDLQNNNAKYSNPRMTMLLDKGGLPHLIRAGQAKVSIRTYRELIVYPLDASGRRMEAIPAELNDGWLNVYLDNRKTGVMAYELVGTE